MAVETLNESTGLEVRLPGIHGSAHVLTRAQLDQHPEWQTMFAGLRKNSRYYEILEETIPQGFEHRYLVLRDSERNIRAIQPMFFWNQDIAQGSGPKIKSLLAALRQWMPGLAVWRTLMVGCAAGEGHLAVPPTGDAAATSWVAQALHAALRQYAKTSRAKMIVLKEFPAEYRPTLQNFAANGYARIPSYPMVRLAIDFPSFDDFALKILSKATRKDLRRKIKKTAPDSDHPVTMEVLTDITPHIDEIYPLYLEVYHRSSLHFEKLTKEYMIGLGRELPQSTRFFMWRLRGKPVAMSLCMLQGDRLYDEYLGLDYSVALDLNLYFLTLHDVLNWAMQQGLKWYYSSALGYDPKLHLKCELVPLDLYVAHTSPFINPLFKKILPFLEPTRKDKILQKFENAASLWCKQ